MRRGWREVQESFPLHDFDPREDAISYNAEETGVKPAITKDEQYYHALDALARNIALKHDLHLYKIAIILKISKLNWRDPGYKEESIHLRGKLVAVNNIHKIFIEEPIKRMKKKQKKGDS